MSCGVAQHLLVVDDGEERGLAIGGEPRRPRRRTPSAPDASVKRAICSSHSALSEAGQTTRTRAMPLRRRQQLAGRDGLDGLAEAHLVGEQRALAERQMQHALALVGQQRMVQQVEAAAAPASTSARKVARACSREVLAGATGRAMAQNAATPECGGGHRPAQPARRRSAPRSCPGRRRACRRSQRTARASHAPRCSRRPSRRGPGQCRRPRRRDDRETPRRAGCRAAAASRNALAPRRRSAASTPSMCLQVPRPLTR